MEIQLSQLPAETPLLLFEISVEEHQKIDQWLEEIFNLYLEEKGLKPKEKHYTLDECYLALPQFGAIGGHLTYQFIPTSLGVIKTAKDSYTGNTFNFTDFSHW